LRTAPLVSGKGALSAMKSSRIGTRSN